jgi:phage-related tail fiber protein
MTQQYYTIITDLGLAKEANIHSGENTTQLTHMAIGDGLGFMYDPDGKATSLKNEVFRTHINKIYVDKKHPNQLIIEAIIPQDSGSFYIREVGIFDSGGDLFAIGKYPETFKPDTTTGSAKDLYIKMILGFSNTPNVSLIVDPSVVLVSVKDIGDVMQASIADHETGVSAHNGAFQGVVDTADIAVIGIHNQYFNGEVTDYGSIATKQAFSAESIPLLRCDLARGGFNYDYEGIT